MAHLGHAHRQNTHDDRQPHAHGGGQESQARNTHRTLPNTAEHKHNAALPTTQTLKLRPCTLTLPVAAAPDQAR